MEEKRLHKSRREGILNNFIETRCSCGNCRCSSTACPCSYSWEYQGMFNGGVSYDNTTAILSSFFYSLSG